MYWYGATIKEIGIKGWWRSTTPLGRLKITRAHQTDRQSHRRRQLLTIWVNEMKCVVSCLLLHLLWNAHKNLMSEMCIERWSDEPSNNQHFSLWTNNATGYGAWIWIAACYLDEPHEYERQRKTCPMQMCVIRTPPTSGTLLIGSPDRKCIPI